MPLKWNVFNVVLYFEPVQLHVLSCFLYELTFRLCDYLSKTHQDMKNHCKEHHDEAQEYHEQQDRPLGLVSQIITNN